MRDFEGFESLKTGFKIIDNQHRKIFEYIENLQELNKKMFDSQNNDELNKKINIFIKYIFDHLIEEENLMKETNYDFYHEHLNEHNKIREDINTILKKNIDSTYNLIFELYKYIMNNYTEHIIFYDKMLAKFLTSKK